MIGIKDDAFLNDNINDIFDRKIEVGPILQFNLLQRLIEEFIKRQKEINDKVNNLETKIIAISAVPAGVNDENILKYLEDSNINFEIEKDLSLNKDKKEKEKEKENEKNNESNDNLINNNEIENNNFIGNNDNDNTDNIIENKNNKNTENKKSNKKNKSNINNIKSNNVKDLKEENNNDINNNNLNLNTNDNVNNNSNNNNEEITHIDTHNSNNQYRKLVTRVDKLEVVLKELMKKIINSSVEQKVNLDQLKSDFASMKKNDNKIKGIEKNINKINQALKDYNILDYFKTENSRDNQENENKNENYFTKIFGKKIDLIESKIKENEEEINKLKKGLTDSNTAIEKYKKNYNDFVLEINTNLNELKVKHNNDINKLKNNLNETIRQIKEELGNKYNQQDRKIKDAITELDENNNNINSNNNANFVASKVNSEKLNNITIELKDYFNKSLSDTEKYLKSLINNLGLDNIRKDLINVHKDLNDKLTKADLDYIDTKLNEIDIRLGNDNLRIDVVKKDIDLCNDSCTKSVKMIEYLSGQVVQAYQPNESQREEIMKKFNKINDIQLTNYINKEDFDKEVNSIYKKIEQTLEVEGENYKFIQHLDSKLKLFATQIELRTMEQSIMNLIEELQNEFSKKFMEKPEILKNIRILELQIKNIYENNGIPHKEGDNWLLAKRPMNNYLCASCESYLGDLKNKNIFLPWNKIPPHENKKYRMGNGFSKMLQLVNMDLMKNAEKINNNLSIRIDDRKSNQELRQLPRISSQISIRHMNNSSTFSPMSNDNSEQRHNNSADGMDNLEDINNNNNQDQNGNANNADNIERNLSVNEDKETSPKLIRIVKKTKKDNY